jgi:hypothetical protein
MVNAVGGMVYSTEHSNGSLDISCGELPAGLYLVRVLPEAGGVVLTSSVMVVR